MLLVGLGNPGKEYENTRHNIGFMAVDAIAHRHNFSTPTTKFRSEFMQGQIGDKKIFAIKPQTFMNKSGVAVQQAMQFYKIPHNEVVVMYDELDLVPGKTRVKTGGGAGGHNGIKSIDAHIGTPYRRVRVGIGHPGDKARVNSYVLGKISEEEMLVHSHMIASIEEAFPLLLDGQDEKFMTKVALLMPQEKKEEEE
jgi:PTH1 family peptidyl-tRNA hydrolase